jgi:hypothetical protein
MNHAATNHQSKQTKKAGNEYSLGILLPAYSQRVDEAPPSIDLPILLTIVYVFWLYVSSFFAIGHFPLSR